MVGTATFPEWVGKDISDLLGYKNYKATLGKLPENEKGVHTVDTLGGPQEMTTVTEAGLYRLIFGSKLPAAEAFKTHVFHEVLPSIRKHGFYSADKTLACRFLELSHALQNANMLPSRAHSLALRLIKISDDSELGDVVRLVETLMSEGGDPDLVKRIPRELAKRSKIAKFENSLRING